MVFARQSKCRPESRHEYDVEIPGIGTIVKIDCCIAHARKWARGAFRPKVCTVRRHVEVKPERLPTGSILRRFGAR